MMQSDLFEHRSGPTLTEARLDLLSKLDEGALCPCCGRFAKRYKRKLNSSLARFLILLCRKSGDNNGWVHVDRELIEATESHIARDYTVLRYFELIEPMLSDDDAKRTSGYWRPTAKGRRFALGWIRVPRYVFVFADRREGFSDDSTDIHEALGDAFHYDELMRGAMW